MRLKIGLLIGLGLVLLTLGAVFGGRFIGRNGEVAVGVEKFGGEYRLWVDGGKRKVTAVALAGGGETGKIKTETRGGLVVEMSNKVGGNKWEWGAVAIGPSSKIEAGKQVWATMSGGKGVGGEGVVILAGEGKSEAREVKVKFGK